MKRTLSIIAFLTIFVLLRPAHADTVCVVVHPQNPVSQIDRSQVMQIFLGKQKRLGNAAPVTPVNLYPADGLRQRFDAELLNKTTTQVRAFWAQQLFTGRGTPPREVTAVDAMKTAVAGTPAAIGYLPKTVLDESVKTVMCVE